MKKLVFVFLAATLIFGCQKKDVKPVQIQQDVVFDVSNVTPGGGLKSTADWEWECPTDGQGNILEPVSAEIDISDGTTTTTYTPAVFRLDGKLYTQAIKLPAADGAAVTYTVTRFVLVDENGVVIMATPTTGSDYSEYVSQGVNFTFEVNAFKKAEIPVEVLCYLPELYSYFGFTWFNVTEIVVREVCFYGDICADGSPWSPADFHNSPYVLQNNGPQVDMPAIMKVHVYRNGVEVPNSPFTNGKASADWGEGAPLCVQYPDNLEATDNFTFKVYLMVRNAGGGYGYQRYYTFTSTDDGALKMPDGSDVDSNGDGVIDFVVGSCGDETADLNSNWLDPLTNIVVKYDDLADNVGDMASKAGDSISDMFG